MAKNRKEDAVSVDYTEQIEDLNVNDIIEFVHPISNKAGSGTYGVGKFVRTIQRRGGNKKLDIEVANSFNEKIIIQENNIRWERTLHHKDKNY
ncbi:MAG: hypothetical protein KAS66_13555 [Candidatus Omnitrophica bacterium]|nr:hypothetical protein [Candidatus Omnitrophota bacterium]